MVKELEIQANVLGANGRLSTKKLSAELETYGKALSQTITDLKHKNKTPLDPDDVFNALDQKIMLSFTANDRHYTLLLSRWTDDKPVPAFGVNYLLDTRNLDDELVDDKPLDNKEYEAGEEQELINDLHQLGVTTI